MHLFDTMTNEIRYGYGTVDRFSTQEKLLLLKYHRALLNLDKSISKLELTSKVRANLQNSINFSIESKLVNLINESDNIKETFELIKHETGRIKTEISHIKENKRYSATMIRSDAKNVLSYYMSEEEMCKIIEKLLTKLKDGSKIAYWNMLSEKRASKFIEELKYKKEESEELFKKDKAFFYSDFIVEQFK